MAPKKTNIKIKHSKFNLYNKKKSKARRALKVILTVVVVCGLGVLGYGLGKPILKYFRERGENSSNADSETSALLSSIMNPESSDGADGEVSSGGSASTSGGGEQPSPQSGEKVYYLPDNAASSNASLSSALAAAKNSGCSVVAVTLKDTSGFLLYKSSYEKVKDTETVTGTLSAAQIASAISREGFTPAARINTLMDKTGSVYVGGNYLVGDPNGTAGWHDNRPENGGKPWMSPFKEQSKSYIEYIANELSAAGFKRIICVNTRYPAFHNSDISSFLSGLPLKDSAKRTAALWDIVNSAKTGADKNGAELWVEISGANLIAEKRDCTDAELITDKTKLKTVKTIVIYDVKSAANGSNTANTSNTSNTSGASSAAAPSDYDTAKDFAAKAKSAMGGAEFGVRLPQSLTGKALEDVTRALSEAGITII